MTKNASFEDIKDKYLTFMNDWAKGKNHRYRSYDYCKDMFDNLYSKKTLNDINLTDDEKDLFALNLYCYLASWGMVCRGSLLMSRSYKFLIPLCDVLFDKKYSELWNIDPLKAYNSAAVMGLYKKMREKIKNTKEADKLADKNATRLLICKILMATYGCVIPYDTYDRDALKKLAVNSRFGINLLDDTCKIITDNGDEFKKIMESIQSEYKVKYTAFKVLDMMLWEYGQK